MNYRLRENRNFRAINTAKTCGTGVDGRCGLQHCQEERLVLALGHGQAHGVQEHGETMRRTPRQRSSSHSHIVLKRNSFLKKGSIQMRI